MEFLIPVITLVAGYGLGVLYGKSGVDEVKAELEALKAKAVTVAKDEVARFHPVVEKFKI